MAEIFVHCRGGAAAAFKGRSRRGRRIIRPSRYGLIIATAAGGLMDVAARVAAENLDKSLGQRLVIENRSGSGGNIGAEAVAKAEPDGYTLGLLQLGNVAINPHVYPDMTFDPLIDLVPVAPVTSSAILVVANAKVPANDLQELIALAKREPGKLSYGSAGAGTAPHLAGEMFKAAAGVDILHVPYRGVGPAVNDMVGGHIQLTFVGLGAVRSAGRGRHAEDPGGGAIAAAQGGAAVSDIGRSRAAGIRVRDLVRHRRAEGHAGAGDRQAGEAHPRDAGRSGGPAQLADGGLEALKETPEQFGARMRRDHERFRDIVKAAKLKPE